MAARVCSGELTRCPSNSHRSASTLGHSNVHTGGGNLINPFDSFRFDSIPHAVQTVQCRRRTLYCVLLLLCLLLCTLLQCCRVDFNSWIIYVQYIDCCIVYSSGLCFDSRAVLCCAVEPVHRKGPSRETFEELQSAPKARRNVPQIGIISNYRVLIFDFIPKYCIYFLWLNSNNKSCVVRLQVTCRCV